MTTNTMHNNARMGLFVDGDDDNDDGGDDDEAGHDEVYDDGICTRALCFLRAFHVCLCFVCFRAPRFRVAPSFFLNGLRVSVHGLIRRLQSNRDNDLGRTK